MHKEADHTVVLLWKYLSEDLSTEERMELDNWANSSEANRKLLEQLDDHDGIRKEFKEFVQLKDYFRKSLDEKFEKTLPTKVVEMQSKKRTFVRWIAAASILLVISIASYFVFFDKQNTSIPSTPVTVKQDVPPGQFKARLMLDDGSTILLDKAATGEITRQGNAVVTNQNGELVYSSSSNATPSKTLFNTLYTGRGETYPTVLSDGSRVWLNNETSIRYPVSFTGSSRVVELKGGEAYFEVAHNSAMPFKVVVNGTEVEVLGTQFSITAFPNEDITKTSLLTGKVKVARKNIAPKILTPGQQANVDKDGKITVVKDADVQGSIAWVHGLFHFEDADLTSVLRQLGRWYDVDFVLSGKISEGGIHGDVERNIPLSKVLSNLERMTGTKFKIEGKKIMVNP